MIFAFLTEPPLGPYIKQDQYNKYAIKKHLSESRIIHYNFSYHA